MILLIRQPVAVPADLVVFGEVGLGGELRSVQQSGRRAKEAATLGFKGCLLPERSSADARGIRELELTGVTTLAEAVETLLR